MDTARFTTMLRTLTTTPSRRAALRVLGGLGLAGVLGPVEAKKRKKKNKKKCAKAGQPTSKKRKRCCTGLVKDGSGVCAPPSPPAPPPSCVPNTCAVGACGEVPDGCGGTLNCGGCPGNQICLSSGVCQPCSVTCLSGDPAICGDDLQIALEAGGTVYVCPGRYAGGFTLSTAVRVIGAGEGGGVASNTILDGQGAERVLTIANVVGLFELERLRVTGGSEVDGGGLVHQGSTLRMTACTVSGNDASDRGGAIFVSPGRTLELLRCTVRDNHADEGGGIASFGGGTLTDCLVEANEADNQGGGLWLDGTTTTLAGSTVVRGNEATFGGGIYVDDAALVIAESCRVAANTAAAVGNGGGILTTMGTVTLQGLHPSPIVVNNCPENCEGTVTGCADEPVSCPP
jgi:hypothetical protein